MLIWPEKCYLLLSLCCCHCVVVIVLLSSCCCHCVVVVVVGLQGLMMHRKFSQDRLLSKPNMSFLAQQRQSLYKNPVSINASMASSVSTLSVTTGCVHMHMHMHAGLTEVGGYLEILVSGWLSVSCKGVKFFLLL